LRRTHRPDQTRLLDAKRLRPLPHDQPAAATPTAFRPLDVKRLRPPLAAAPALLAEATPTEFRPLDVKSPAAATTHLAFASYFDKQASARLDPYIDKYEPPPGSTPFSTMTSITAQEVQAIIQASRNELYTQFQSELNTLREQLTTAQNAAISAQQQVIQLQG
jgi:hypothetical protein